MAGREEKTRALEEAVRLLEGVKVGSHLLGELDFEDARVDGYIAMALSAARSTLAIAVRPDDPEATR